MPEAKSKKPGGRFSVLRELREQREESLEDDIPVETTLTVEESPAATAEGRGERTAPPDPPQPAIAPPSFTDKSSKPSSRTKKTAEPDDGKRGPGRPRGRRSDPDYTQISAYIPLDLLLDVQEELNDEKRIQRKRTAMSVSELVEDLLTDWLKNRKIKKAK
jgi:hypothetical protein